MTRVLIASLVATLTITAMCSADEPDASLGSHIPSWAYGAHWYQMDLDTFRNGDPSNDRTGTSTWRTSWPPEGAELTQRGGPAAGGDLKGLQSKLGYLQGLGINAIYIRVLFFSDFSHVSDAFGVNRSYYEIQNRADRSKEPMSASDRLFVEVLADAHKRGIRVVSAIGLYAESKRFTKNLTRWLDPNGDGDPSDGLDGWVVVVNEDTDEAPIQRLRKSIKSVNPNALIIGEVRGDKARWLKGDTLDVISTQEAGAAIRRFFHPANKSYTLDKMFGHLAEIQTTYTSKMLPAMPSGVSEPGPGRLLTALTSPTTSESSSDGLENPNAKGEEYDRWRLATVLHHFVSGAPITYCGDEVGMRGGWGLASAGPLWWTDLENEESKPKNYRQDFYDLIALLHQRSAQHRALRQGTMRPVLLDSDRKILSFARTVPEEEVIVVMNYGSGKQRLKVPIGRADKVVGILTPQLRPKKGSGSTLNTDGVRQTSNKQGEVTITVDPMSIRIIVVPDDGSQ